MKKRHHLSAEPGRNRGVHNKHRAAWHVPNGLVGSWPELGTPRRWACLSLLESTNPSNTVLVQGQLMIR